MFSSIGQLLHNETFLSPHFHSNDSHFGNDLKKCNLRIYTDTSKRIKPFLFKALLDELSQFEGDARALRARKCNCSPRQKNDVLTRPSSIFSKIHIFYDCTSDPKRQRHEKKTMWSQIISCLKQEHDNLHLKKWEYITTVSILTEPLETSDLFKDWDGLLWKIFRATQVSPMKLLRPSLSSSKTWSLWKVKNATKCFMIGMTANIVNTLVLILGTLANKFWDPKRD